MSAHKIIQLHIILYPIESLYIRTFKADTQYSMELTSLEIKDSQHSEMHCRDAWSSGGRLPLLKALSSSTSKLKSLQYSILLHCALWTQPLSNSNGTVCIHTVPQDNYSVTDASGLILILCLIGTTMSWASTLLKNKIYPRMLEFFSDSSLRK